VKTGFGNINQLVENRKARPAILVLGWPSERAKAILRPEALKENSMARKRKRATTKPKRGKTRPAMRKKAVKRPAPKRTKKSVKKRPVKTRRITASKRVQARRPKRGATPVVRQTVIDVVDEPLPGVMRVTEIEETEVSVPESKDQEEE
jgi:hypothetical protein